MVLAAQRSLLAKFQENFRKISDIAPHGLILFASRKEKSMLHRSAQQYLPTPPGNHSSGYRSGAPSRGLVGLSQRCDVARSFMAGRLASLALLGIVGLLGPGTTPALAAPFAYIPNADSNTVSVIDTATNTVTATVPVGEGPHGVAVHPAGTFVYVTNYASDTVSVINTTNQTVAATVSVGEAPLGLAVHPAGAFVYVVNSFSPSVSVIDTATHTVTATVRVGEIPIGVAVHPAGTFVYVTHHANPTVSVIDTATNTVTTTVPVGSCPS